MATITPQGESRKAVTHAVTDAVPSKRLSRVEDFEALREVLGCGVAARWKLCDHPPLQNSTLYETLPTSTLLVVSFRGGGAIAHLWSTCAFLCLAAPEA